jgi:hypothetical protein
MQSAVARFNANWMFFNTAMRISALTSTSCGMADKGSMKDTSASTLPSAIRALSVVFTRPPP